MGGTFSVGGLASGIDSNNLIKQLILFERRPLIRLENRIKTLESQKDAIKELRTQILDFRNTIKDIQFAHSIFRESY